MTPEDSTALAAAESLEAAMRSLSADLSKLRGYGRRNRILISVVGGVVAVLILLGGVLAHTVQRANDAASEAKRATSAAAQSAANQQASCIAGNDTRALSRQLWLYVLDLSAKPTASAEEKKKSADFRTYVNTTFAARDCSKLAPAN